MRTDHPHHPSPSAGGASWHTLVTIWYRQRGPYLSKPSSRDSMTRNITAGDHAKGFGSAHAPSESLRPRCATHNCRWDMAGLSGARARSGMILTTREKPSSPSRARDAACTRPNPRGALPRPLVACSSPNPQREAPPRSSRRPLGDSWGPKGDRCLEKGGRGCWMGPRDGVVAFEPRGRRRRLGRAECRASISACVC